MPLPYSSSETEGEGTANGGPGSKKHESLIKVSFSRYPIQLRDALQNGRLLAPVWDALKAAGLSHVLKAGARVICAVHQYNAVVNCASQSEDIRPYHVLVTQSYRDLLFKTIWQLCRSRRGVRLKTEEVIGMVPAAQPVLVSVGDPSAALTVSALEAFDDGVGNAGALETYAGTPPESSSSEKLNKSGSGGEESGSGKSGSGKSGSKGSRKSAQSGNSVHGSGSGGSGSGYPGSGHGSGSGVSRKSGQGSGTGSGSGSGMSGYRPDSGSGSGSGSRGTESRESRSGLKPPPSSSEGLASMDTTVPPSGYGSSHSSNSNNRRKDTDGNDAITLISFSRYPVELRWALQSGPLLVPIREVLRTAGHSYELPSGAKLYCGPDQYEAVAVIMSRADVDVRPYHVVFTDSAREAVMETIGSLRRALKVRVKQEVCLGHVDASKCMTPPNGLASPSKGGQGKFGSSLQELHGKAKGYQTTDSSDETPEEASSGKGRDGQKRKRRDGSDRPTSPALPINMGNLNVNSSKGNQKGKKGNGKGNGKFNGAANGAANGVGEEAMVSKGMAVHLAAQLAGILETQDDAQGTLATSFMEGLDTMLQVYKATKEAQKGAPLPWPQRNLPMPQHPMFNIADLIPNAQQIPAEWLAQYDLHNLPQLLQ